MAMQSVSIAVTGSGGSGVMTAGQLPLDAAAGVGWYGVMTRSFGPQIRGGEAGLEYGLIDAGGARAAETECETQPGRHGDDQTDEPDEHHSGRQRGKPCPLPTNRASEPRKSAKARRGR